MINHLYHDDAINILKKIPDNSIDMIFTDPPYNTTDLKIDKKGFNLNDYLLEMKRVLKINGWFFSFMVEEQMAIIVYERKFKRKFTYIWEKPMLMRQFDVVKRPFMKHEMIYAFINPELKVMAELYFDKISLRLKGKPYHVYHKANNNNEFAKAQRSDVIDRETINSGYREGTTILCFPNKSAMKVKERTPHPTQKPLELCQLICKGYCPENGIVLDCFCGSGSVLLAAKTTNRNYIGCEINKEYYSMAKNRLDSTLF